MGPRWSWPKPAEFAPHHAGLSGPFFNVFCRRSRAAGPEYPRRFQYRLGARTIKKLDKMAFARPTAPIAPRVYYLLRPTAQMRYYGIDEVGFPPGPLDQAGWDAINDFCVASVTPLYGGLRPPRRPWPPLRMPRSPSPKSDGRCTCYDSPQTKKPALRRLFSHAEAAPPCSREIAAGSHFCSWCATPVNASSTETAFIAAAPARQPPPPPRLSSASAVDEGRFLSRRRSPPAATVSPVSWAAAVWAKSTGPPISRWVRRWPSSSFPKTTRRR